MKTSRRILVIVTRVLAKLGERQDEFAVLWKQPIQESNAIFSCQGHTIVLIHGYRELFDYDSPEKSGAVYAARIQHALKHTRVSPTSEIAMLLHIPIKYQAFIQGVTRELKSKQHISLKGVACYSSIDEQHSDVEILASQASRGEDFTKMLSTVWQYYLGNGLLEKRLITKHNALLAGNPSNLNRETPIKNKQAPIYVAWNKHPYTEVLKKYFGDDQVLTSREMFNKVGKRIKNLLVLAELSWDNRCSGQFYGFEFVRELIDAGNHMNICLASVLSYEQLRQQHASAAILSTCLPLIELNETNQAFFETFSMPDFTPLDWMIIRQCYLSETSIFDRVLHDLSRFIGRPNESGVQQLLRNIDIHEHVFPVDMRTTARQQLHNWKSMSSEKKIEYLKQLREHLEKSSQDAMIQENSKAKQTVYQMMIVEDQPETLNALKEGFSHYFRVNGVSDGARALTELKKCSDAYAVLLVDLELLDEIGRWQPVQGYHLIQAVQCMPHLVVYMLTAHSKHFVSVVQRALQSSPDVFTLPGYLPKHPYLGLRGDYSYEEVSETLLREIETKTDRLKGPRIGVWRKGMLQAYYRMLTTEKGKKLWEGVTEAVERCITSGQNDDVIPCNLFSANNRKFNDEKIRTALMHRLISLYFQYEEGKVAFEEAIKPFLKLRQSDPQRYFGTLLGFSIRCEEVGSLAVKQHVCYLQKSHLFQEEIDWLKKMFPEDDTLTYPHLIEVLSEALSSPVLNTSISWTKIKSIDSLQDCVNFLNHIIQISRLREELIIDIQAYQRYFVSEWKKLQQDPNLLAQELVKLILALTSE